jgi:hypothetical protein
VNYHKRLAVRHHSLADEYSSLAGQHKLPVEQRRGFAVSNEQLVNSISRHNNSHREVAEVIRRRVNKISTLCT